MIMNEGIRPGATNRSEHRFSVGLFGVPRNRSTRIRGSGQFALDKHKGRDTTPEQTLMGECVLHKSRLAGGLKVKRGHGEDRRRHTTDTERLIQ